MKEMTKISNTTSTVSEGKKMQLIRQEKAVGQL